MILKEPGTEPNTVRVTFELPSSVWAEQVTLVGSFNDWDQVRTPMRQGGPDGAWRVTLELAAKSEFQYRYLIDGETWHTDYNADGYVANEYGSDNAVVKTTLPGMNGGAATETPANDAPPDTLLPLEQGADRSLPRPPDVNP